MSVLSENMYPVKLKCLRWLFFLFIFGNEIYYAHSILPEKEKEKEKEKGKTFETFLRFLECFTYGENMYLI
jgi:hypothetical protein